MYASKSTVAIAVIAGLLLASPAALAQPGGGAGAQSRSRMGGGMRLQDHDRLWSRDMDRMHDRMQDRLYERDLRRERDRDRIYGGNLMSGKERARYVQRLRSLPRERDRVRFRMSHQHRMRMRAEERHERLGPAPSESRIRAQERGRQQEREQVYGYAVMTPQEVARYEARMGAARTKQERERIRSEHRRQMDKRVRGSGAAPPRQ